MRKCSPKEAVQELKAALFTRFVNDPILYLKGKKLNEEPAMQHTHVHHIIYVLVCIRKNLVKIMRKRMIIFFFLNTYHVRYEY